MSGLLQGLRIVVTQAEDFMGPALCQVLSSHGATVLADQRQLHLPDASKELVQSHGHIDVLVANLAMTAPATPAAEVQDEEWAQVFNTMVHPLPRLLREVLPQMQARGRGKFLVMGSASALRGMKRASSYSAAPSRRTRGTPARQSNQLCLSTDRPQTLRLLLLSPIALKELHGQAVLQSGGWPAIRGGSRWGSPQNSVQSH